MAIKRHLNNSISISIHPLDQAEINTQSFTDCASQVTVQEIVRITLNSPTRTKYKRAFVAEVYSDTEHFGEWRV